MVVSTGFAVIRPQHLNPAFASWALRQHGFVEEIVACSTGGSYQAINPSQIADLPIPLPPINEQQAVAAFLDRETGKIDELVAKKRLLIERLDEYRTALITRTVTRGLPHEDARAAGLDASPRLISSSVEWLGEIPEHWKVGRLKDAGRLVAGSAFPEALQGIDGEVLPFFKVGDLKKATDGLWMTESDHTISHESAAMIKARVIPAGAVVYAKIGAALLLNRRRITSKPACIDNNMSAYIPDKNLTTMRWALYALSLLDFSIYVNPGAIPSLSEGDQADLPIPLPPIAEQRAIAAYLDDKTQRIDALSSKTATAIELLAEYRTALVTAAVTGQIDVRDAAPVEPRRVTV